MREDSGNQRTYRDSYGDVSGSRDSWGNQRTYRDSNGDIMEPKNLMMINPFKGRILEHGYL